MGSRALAKKNRSLQRRRKRKEEQELKEFNNTFNACVFRALLIHSGMDKHEATEMMRKDGIEIPEP